MRFDLMLIGLLVITFFTIGGSFMIADMNENYGSLGVNISDERFEAVFNTTDEIYDIARDTKEKTIEGDISETDSWESMTKGSYSAVRLVGKSFSLFNDLTNSVAITLSIPTFIVDIVFTSFVLLVIFGIVYMIFRYKD